jgi:prevent-host-death family protein
MTNKRTKKYKQPESRTVSVAEGKKRFSGLMRDAMEQKTEFIITKRGKPVAAIIPYEEYKRSKRVEGYQKIMKAREAFLKLGVSSDEVFQESKKQLEKKV